MIRYTWSARSLSSNDSSLRRKRAFLKLSKKNGRDREKRKRVRDTFEELQKCRNYVLQFRSIRQLVTEIDNADAGSIKI